MSIISEIRQKYPQYKSETDGDLLMGVHQKFYRNMHVKDFMKRADPEGNARFSIKKKWDYWKNQVSRPLEGETADQMKVRTGGDMRETVTPIEGAGRGFLQGSTFTFGDELVGAGAAALHPLVHGDDGSSFGERFRTYQGREEGRVNRFRETDPGKAIASEVGGALTTGLMAPTIAPIKGAGMMPSLANATATGTAYGTLAGAGADSENRLRGAVYGGLGGAILGPVADLAIRGAGAALRPITSRLNPDKAAKNYLARLLTRSGQGADDVADEMAQAIREGQDEFMLADALGHPGQRGVAAVSRTPNDARTAVVEALQSRQAGQSNRVSQMLAEAFDAPDTAADVTGALIKSRRADANVAYEAARQAAGPVNLSGAIDKIDDSLNRNPILGEAALSKTEIGRRLSRLRKKLTNKGQQLIDFDDVLNIKSDLGRQLESMKSPPPQLWEVHRALDAALEEASDAYRAANDSYRAASKVIDAVDKGAKASGRVRAGDSVAQFSKMTDAEKAAFKAGYADRLIGRTESQALGANAARPFVNRAAEQKAVGFAGQKGERLNRQLGREMTMAETRQAGVMGSHTADNIEDIADLAVSDPSIINAVLSGSPREATRAIGGRIASELGGVPPSVAERVGKTLLINNADVVKAALAKAVTQGRITQKHHDAVVRALLAPAIVGGVSVSAN